MGEMTIEQQRALALASARLRMQESAAPESAPNPSEGGLPFRPLGMDTGLTMPEWLSRAAAGGGKALADIGRGAAQMVGAGPSGAEVEQIRKQDAPLMSTGAGLAGNIGMNIAATLPAMAIPGVNSYAGAAALGGALGSAQPIGTDESRTQNALLGGGAGIAGQGIGNALSRFIQPVKSSLTPEQMRLAQVALNENIPLGAAELTGSKPLKIVNSVFGNLPLTAGSEAKRTTAQIKAFNKAALAKAGIDADVATPAILANQKGELGTVFEDIAGRNKVKLFTPAEIPKSSVTDWQILNKAAPIDRGVAGQLDDIARNATTRLEPDAAARVSDRINKILSDVDKDGYMLGTNYQAWREPLRLDAKKGDAEARIYGQIRRTLDSAFTSQLSGADAKAWKEASQKYANLKTITAAMSGNTPNVAAGNISPAQLGMALSQQIGKEGKALGRGELNDLVRAGNIFVRDQIPDSGTAQRQLYQSLLTGGGGAGVGALAAGLTGGDWKTGAAYGAGIAGTGLIAPKIAQQLINNPRVQNYLITQAGSPQANALAQMLQNSIRSAGTAAALPYMAQ